MSLNKHSRESNIELLRILTMMGVIILHYNNASIGKGFSLVETNSLNYFFLNFIESVFVCAVDLFMIISGYFMFKSNKRDLWKPIQLLIQVMIFSSAKYIFFQGVLERDFEFGEFVRSLIPSNYFVILYIVVFLVSPYINILFNNINEKQTCKLIIILIILFSLYPTAVDVLREVSKTEFIGLSSIGMYGSQYGYSIINFILCYCIGIYIRKNEANLKKISNSLLIVVIIVSVFVMTVWSLINDMVGYYVEKSAWEYCNPLVILTGGCFFLLFKRINIKKSKSINSLAKGSFTVYLLHINLVTHINIVKFINRNIIILIFHMVCSVVMIYISCWCVYYVYSKIENIVFSKIKRMVKLPILEA